MTVVQVRDGDPVEKALRKFRRKVEQAGIRKEIRKREYYLKPGEQRRKKEREADRRRFKAIKKAKQGKSKRSRTFRR
jgi:small subunit ribosomal protein S21